MITSTSQTQITSNFLHPVRFAGKIYIKDNLLRICRSEFMLEKYNFSAEGSRKSLLHVHANVNA